MCRNLIFSKVKLFKSATSLKTSFLMKFAKSVGIPFLQNTTGQLLLIMAVSKVVKRKLANETLIYDRKTKAYVQV